MRFLCMRYSILVVGALLFALTAFVQVSAAQSAAASASTTTSQHRFEEEIQAFEAADRNHMPAPDGVVFVGSSSIRTWNLDEYFPKKGYINRGFGGSQMSDALYYVDRIVTKYKPRTVVLYEGDNDIAAGVPEEQILIDFGRFVEAVHAKLPQTRIIFISIKPSPARWAIVDRMRAANSMIKTYIERNDQLAYIDADQAFLGWDKKPRPKFYDPEGLLHPSAEGRGIWAFLLTPFLNDDTPASVAKK